MTQGKITQVQGNGHFDTANGRFFSFHVELDGNALTLFEVNAKTETPRWKVGDTVWYEVTGEYKGVKKAKFSTQDPATSGAPRAGARPQDPETTKRIENSWAVQTAIQLHGPIDTGENLESYLTRIQTTAGLLLTTRDAVQPLERVKL